MTIITIASCSSSSRNGDLLYSLALFAFSAKLWLTIKNNDYSRQENNDQHHNSGSDGQVAETTENSRPRRDGRCRLRNADDDDDELCLTKRTASDRFLLENNKKCDNNNNEENNGHHHDEEKESPRRCSNDARKSLMNKISWHDTVLTRVSTNELHCLYSILFLFCVCVLF